MRTVPLRTWSKHTSVYPAHHLSAHLSHSGWEYSSYHIDYLHYTTPFTHTKQSLPFYKVLGDKISGILYIIAKLTVM